ncbi:hypothetical protein FE257_010428 [Aspergillus nanangensis]|uniref:Enoyl reductase (ER) domain-containing protein n=1 Tax=Aspergillus nanangensis TaxID=2582783 RepID=A0AAD4GR85_ASPNN|nr:hypothetical protein FE257_010428 [Aspergillus nanangensis]
MRHVYLSSHDTYSLQETADPTPQKNTDVIIKITATTICGSDVHLIHGEMPTPWGFPLGHEFVGTIHKIGSEVQSLRVGDRVACPAAVWCGQCDNCRVGQRQACSNGSIFGSGKAFGSLGGAQAEFIRVPFADVCVSVIPDAVSDRNALAVGDILCTGWTAVKNAVTGNQLEVKTLVVFGAGPIGLSAVHTSRLVQGLENVVMVDILADRLDVARKLGATHVVNPAAGDDLAQVVSEITGGRGAEATIDAAGVKGSISLWSEVTAIGGKVAVVAIPSGPVEVSLSAIVMRNITIWTGLGDVTHMDMLLGHINDGRLDPSPIFSETVAFDDIENTLKDFVSRKPGLIKPFIIVG